MSEGTFPVSFSDAFYRGPYGHDHGHMYQNLRSDIERNATDNRFEKLASDARFASLEAKQDAILLAQKDSQIQAERLAKEEVRDRLTAEQFKGQTATNAFNSLNQDVVSGILVKA